MDDDGARSVAERFRNLFHELHDRFRAQVRGLDHGTVNWRPLPKANSIAVLVTHALGSEIEMLQSVRRLPNDRDREAEFKVEAEASALLALLDRADREVEEHLGGLTAADLVEDRKRADGETKPGLAWLISNYGHGREHLAHVELTKQLYDSRT